MWLTGCAPFRPASRLAPSPPRPRPRAPPSPPPALRPAPSCLAPFRPAPRPAPAPRHPPGTPDPSRPVRPRQLSELHMPCYREAAGGGPLPTVRAFEDARAAFCTKNSGMGLGSSHIQSKNAHFRALNRGVRRPPNHIGYFFARPRTLLALPPAPAPPAPAPSAPAPPARVTAPLGARLRSAGPAGGEVRAQRCLAPVYRSTGQ